MRDHFLTRTQRSSVSSGTPSLIEDPSALKQDIPGAAPDAGDERERACSLLVGDAAGGGRRRDDELPVDDLGTNRRCSPSAICPLAFGAGGLRGAQRQNGDEREEKARADAEPMAAKPHLTRMARGQSSRIGRSAHLQLRQVLFPSVTPERIRSRNTRRRCSKMSRLLVSNLRSLATPKDHASALAILRKAARQG